MPKKKKAGKKVPGQEIRKYFLRSAERDNLKVGENSSEWQLMDNMAEVVDSGVSEVRTAEQPEVTEKDKQQTSGEEKNSGEVNKTSIAEKQQNKGRNPLDTDSENNGESDKILKAIAGMEQRLDSKIEKLKEDIVGEFEQKVEKLTKKMDTLEQSLNYAHKEIEDLKKDKVQLQKDLKRAKERLDNTQKETKLMKNEMETARSDIAEKLNEAERYTRSFGIRVYNFPELPKNASTETYVQCLAEKLVECDVVEEEVEVVRKEIETAHPIGRSGDQLIARFHSRPYRNKVLREARKKLTRESEHDLKVVEDMTKIDYDRKKRAIPAMQRAYAEGKKAVFKNGRLIIDGRTVAV